ncbi:Myc-type basic helix-loop-helix (bHLH) domain-containing protein [Dioscorea alata]|uniref:Myc-type basic helix-loop-helix (BHLH) domain-containing protein n=1 Tax=Dioscorea alata TaxID=55571 RepID=A0ACB7W8V7_DIOAL|nr:Myc-type basic helix-loop-helix (bHLH) domain-containing protein [Dioscorea alata]
MEAASDSGREFPEPDEPFEGEPWRRNGSSRKGEMMMRMDGVGRDQKSGEPTTPRSKHSATEQRRRSKINERFQILRDLIPHSDQKRDKASFLLEVIEYIHYLQEKVQKYESIQPGWIQENEKLVPWTNNQGPVDGIPDASQIMKNGPSPGFMFGKFDERSVPLAPSILSNAHNPTESDMRAGVQSNLYATVGGETNHTQQQQRLVSNSDNLASHSQSPWLRSYNVADCTLSSDILNEQEGLAIDEGTISVSSVYSHGLLGALSQALQSSGLDLSQANVSVQINLGKRAARRRTTNHMTNLRDQNDPSGNQAMEHSRVGSSDEESEKALKKHRSDSC